MITILFIFHFCSFVDQAWAWPANVPVGVWLIILVILVILVVTYSVLIECLRRRVRKALKKQNDLTEQLPLALRAGNMSVWCYRIEQDRFDFIYGHQYIPNGSNSQQCIERIAPGYRDEFVDAIVRLRKGDYDRRDFLVEVFDTTLNTYRIVNSCFVPIKRGEQTVKIIGTYKDVTDHYTWQQQLSIASQRFNMVFDSASIGLSYYDKQGNLLDINKAALDIYGIGSKAEAMSRKVNMFASQSIIDKELSAEKLNKHIENIVDYDFDKLNSTYPGITNKRGRALIRFRHVPMHNANGDVEAYFLTLSDVTNEIESNMRFEKLYCESEMLLNSLPVAVVVLDKSGFYMKVNNTFVEMLGIKDEEQFIAKHHSLFDNPCMESTTRSRLKKMESTDFDCVCDFDNESCRDFFLSSLRGKRYISGRFRALIGANGDYYGFIVILSDMTAMERKHHENMLIKETLSIALEASQMLVWSCDVKKGEVSIVNNPDGSSGTYTIEQLFDCLADDDDRNSLSNIITSMIGGEYESAHTVVKASNHTIGSETNFYELHMKIVANDSQEINLIGTCRNITNEQLNTAQLKENIKMTALSLKAANMMAWGYDVKRQLLSIDFDPSVAQTTYVTIDQMMEMTERDSKQKVKEACGRMANGEDFGIDLEVTVVRPDNRARRNLVYSGVPIERDSNGKVVRYAGVCRNKTEQVKVMRDLERANQNNRLVLDNCNTGFTFLAPDYTVEWENTSHIFPNTNHSHRYRRGRKCYMFEGGTGSVCEGCTVAKSLLSGKTEQREVYDSGLILEHTAIPVFDHSGNRTGTVIKSVDVTQQKHFVEELQKSRNEALLATNLIKTIIDRLPCSLFIKDANNDYRYTTTNRLFCKYVGLPEQEIIGRNDSELPIDRARAKRFMEEDERVVANNETLISYDDTCFENQQMKWQTFKSSFVDSERTLIIGISLNITDLKRSMEELKKAKELAERSDVLKSVFLANMSHEIRTPLNAIVGFADLLVQTDDKREKADYSRLIDTNSSLLLNLINDILDLSKIESGYLVLKDTHFDLAQLFNELKTTFDVRVQKGVVLRCVNPYRKCMVLCDYNRIMQLMNNLISNAIKYTPSGSITIGYQIVDNGVKMYVSDTGIGISQANKERVFKRFEKFDTFAQGTGLGLSICKALCDSMKGKIGFDSETGIGSTFWVELPIRIESVEEKR